jgi:putative superfamily III holin-X
MQDNSNGGGAADRSFAELTRQLSDQTSQLIRQELELAKAELEQKGKQVGLGAGMFGGAGVFVVYALGALTACAILALATAVEPWLAALIVAVVWAAVAGALALTGKGRIEKGTPPVPEQAIESVKEDVEWTKSRANAAKQ